MPRKKQVKKELVKAPKGMHDILGETYYNYQGFFEKAQEVAVYYGFQPIETPILEHEDIFTSGAGEGSDIVQKEMYTLRTKGGDKLALRPEGTAAIMRAYLEHGMWTKPQPVMVYYYGPFFRHERPQQGRFRQHRQFGIEMLGTQKAISDAIIIRTFVAILEQMGLKDLTVQINSIGDKECKPAYTRALTAYYKKHVREICVQCKERLKKNPLRVLDCKNKQCQPIKEGAPETLNHLCNNCKKHFKEVLECLGSAEIPYAINNSLVRGLDYYTRTVFEITLAEPEPEKNEGDPVRANESKDSTSSGAGDENASENEEGAEKAKGLAIAGGGRYDGLARTLGHKKAVSAVGGSIGVDRVLAIEETKIPSPRIQKKPKVYFIQLGFEARLKSLTVIEILRKARVPIAQSLAKDGLAVQLSRAEKSGAPYAVIFGQKEAKESAVIVRNMETRSQETVKIEDLAEYLKTMK